MSSIPIEQVRPGMILAQDIRAGSGNVLLKKGVVLEEGHIRILLAREVKEIAVEESGNDLDPQEAQRLLEEARDFVLPFFHYVDNNHPAILELYRISLQRVAGRLRDGWRTPSRPPRIDSQAEHLRDLFLREQGTPEDLVRHEVELVSFPDIYFQILKVLRSPTASATHIAEVVSRDQSLTAILLKLVNSPYFGFASHIDSLPRAVALVGAKELSTLALGISAIKVFKDIPPELVDMHSFWKHSLACGIFAKLLANQVDPNEEERFFVCGLLHDIGKLLLYKKLPYAASQALVYARENKVPDVEAERIVLGFDHTDVGAALMTEWNFPEVLSQSIALHHAPTDMPTSGPSLIHVADLLTCVAEITSGSQRVVPGLVPQAWEQLALRPSDLPLLFRRFDKLMLALGSVLFGK